ncbi:ubiquitin carboxyl-terminal hydrolase 16-like isoform X2 [Argopecten irradians]|uniref:ubiquitin carboxyl-terminal hydrolase 16-like isoform X2 n=1 Tax=Argopecten irradians TaxID=31199 RepID=UPI0037105E40
MMGFPWEEISSLIWKWFIYKQTQVSLTWKQWGLPKKAGCICGMSVLVFAYIVIKVKRRQPLVERRNGARREIQGIPNIGNTCYMNAVLQMFCRTPHFRERLQQAVEKKWKQVGCLELLKELFIPPPPQTDVALLGLVEAVAYESPVPSSFPFGVLNAVREIDKTFKGNNQQDSYQFFNTVMEGLEDCSQWKKRKRVNPNETATETLMNNSPVSRLFGGVFCAIYTYDTCKHIEPVFQRFTSIPVQVNHMAEDENPALPPHVATDQPYQAQQQLDWSEKSNDSKQKQEGEQEATDQPYQSQQQQSDETDKSTGSEQKQEGKQEATDQPNQSQKQQLDGNDKSTGSEQKPICKQEATDQPNQSQQQQLEKSDKLTGSEQKQDGEQEATGQPNQSQQQQLDESNKSNSSEQKPKEEQEVAAQPYQSQQQQIDGSDKSTGSEQKQEGEQDETDQPNQSQQQQLDESDRLESENSLLTSTDQTKMPKQKQLDESTQQKQHEKNHNCTPEPPPCHHRLRNLPETLTDLEKGLMMWTDIECFQKLSCRICEKEGVTKGKPVVSSSRTLLMAPLPPVLVFQFNRFKMGSEGTLEKMDKKLSYPECFDMAPYCSNGVDVYNMMTGSDSGEYRYRLYGVVSHSGSSRGGHYKARVRKTRPQQEGHQEEGQWQDPERFKDDIMQFWEGKKQLSDYKPTESTPDTWYTISDTLVNEENSETALCDPNAYLLFYKRVSTITSPA